MPEIIFAEVKLKKFKSHFLKGKAVSVYEPPLFQGLPHRYMLNGNSPVSRGTVALSNTMVTVLARGIHPSLIQECFHSSTGNLISFYPTTKRQYIASK